MESTASSVPPALSAVDRICDNLLSGSNDLSSRTDTKLVSTTVDAKQTTPVLAHPLQDAHVESSKCNPPNVLASAHDEIAQKNVKHILNTPPHITPKLLKRMHNPRCPRCYTRYNRPPPQWDCTVCWQQDGNKIKVWQRDDDSNVCMLCDNVIGRWSRHHCRSCGRLVCSKCCSKRAIMPSLGFVDPQKVCDECISLLANK